MMTAAHGGLRAPYRVRSIDCAKRWSLSDIACCRKLTERESNATASSSPVAGDDSRAAASNCVAAACAAKALSSWISASVSIWRCQCGVDSDLPVDLWTPSRAAQEASNDRLECLAEAQACSDSHSPCTAQSPRPARPRSCASRSSRTSSCARCFATISAGGAALTRRRPTA